MKAIQGNVPMQNPTCPLLGEARVTRVMPPGVCLGGFPDDVAGIQNVEITPPLTFVGTGSVG
jgi:hypothetical protein